MCEHCGCGVPHDHGHEHESGAQTIQVLQDVLAHDRAHAESLRTRLRELNSRLVNIIGSPGCGKTELLSVLIPNLAEREMHCVVIEGDLATDNDAKRIRKTGAPVYQVTTGTACHLTAHEVEHAVSHLSVEPRSLILVENVGNLVCPSMFDIGESLRIVCLSVTEGTDKPQKYPVSFREADLAVITKHDLLGYVDFDLDTTCKMIHDIKPDMPCLITSAKDGSGLKELASKITALWDD
ncbi:MAG: hydrogenase nickel incorporation protein HypB [Proteobacteria bacterium]|nr:hydrogenase nickel incorporation protein HypB [Pseudomonadota bacterium]